MSVIVKGMKMPENCWECTETRLSVGISVFGGMCPYCEKIRTDHNMKTGRHPECPLGALPDKHGRLGDLDALIRDHFSPEHRIALSEANKTWMRKIINDAPTIVEAEGEE